MSFTHMHNTYICVYVCASVGVGVDALACALAFSSWFNYANREGFTLTLVNLCNNKLQQR